MRNPTPDRHAAYTAAQIGAAPAEGSHRFARRSRPRSAARLLLAPASATLLMLAADAPRAQRTRERPVTLTGVAARRTPDGKTIYTLSADSRLDRAQTWQDEAGQHVVIVNGGARLGGSLPAGVQVNRVSDSLEVVLPAGADGRALVEPRGNVMEVVVSGAHPTPSATRATEEASAPSAARVVNPAASRGWRGRSWVIATALPNPARAAKSSSNEAPFHGATPDVAAPAVDPLAAAQVASAAPAVAPPAASPAPAAATPQTAPSEAAGDEASGATPLVFVVGAGLSGALGLLFVRRRRQADEAKRLAEFFDDAPPPPAPATTSETAKNRTKPAAKSGKGLLGRGVFGGNLLRKAAVKANESDARSTPGKQTSAAGDAESASALAKSDAKQADAAKKIVKPSAPAPAAIYGAYQVDQEVGKLVRGEAHRVDVLCSRAPEDRHAIEASLMKTLQTADITDTARRKARQALEEYGFVARLCAGLLLAPQAIDRQAAAGTLATIGSPVALQFLIEALYDRETNVRQAAVAGLGALRSPAAIGALLDIARRHADIPPALLTSALTACSVESLDFGGGGSGASESAQLAASSENVKSGADGWDGEITGLEPVETIVALPEWSEDDDFADALARLDSADTEARAAAARQLAQHPVGRAVEALAHLAAHDPDSSVRAAAVTSLGALDHETVFAPVLLRLVDEAREVRAAAARALSRLSFDRADAYVRVIETADEAALRDIARALAEAGLATQAVNRVVSDDRRQAYEAFSLLSLLVKAGEVEPLLEQIAAHRDTDVRLALVRLLGLSGGALYADRLEEVASRPEVREEVRGAIVETCDKIARAEAF